jgi:hypothetical protein
LAPPTTALSYLGGRGAQQQTFAMPSFCIMLMLLMLGATMIATAHLPLMEAILMGGLLTSTMACGASAGVSNNGGESQPALITLLC